MLHDVQVTSAPSATSVSISTAVSIVMCRQPATRAPFRGFLAPNSSRRAIRPGVSFSAIRIFFRPSSARDRSFSLYAGNSVRLSIVLSLFRSFRRAPPGRRGPTYNPQMVSDEDATYKRKTSRTAPGGAPTATQAGQVSRCFTGSAPTPWSSFLHLLTAGLLLRAGRGTLGGRGYMPPDHVQ